WDQLRQQLGDSLVHFSEKVLFVANNDVLLGAPSGSSDRQRYIMVLQAVGNSILGQLDELRFRRQHGGALQLRAPAELEALRRAVSPTPREILNDLLANLRGSAKAVTGADSAKAQERLRYENSVGVLEGYAEAILKGLPNDTPAGGAVLYARINTVLNAD